MQGFGFYRYADGKQYEGQFLMDKKEGFGIFHWINGSSYEGQWHKGKQHGLGIYFDSANQKPNHGLWDQGKRLGEWFGPQEVRSIERIGYQYSQEFNDPQKNRALQTNVRFGRPVEFDEEKEKVRQYLNLIK